MRVSLSASEARQADERRGARSFALLFARRSPPVACLLDQCTLAKNIYRHEKRRRKTVRHHTLTLHVLKERERGRQKDTDVLLLKQRREREKETRFPLLSRSLQPTSSVAAPDAADSELSYSSFFLELALLTNDRM